MPLKNLICLVVLIFSIGASTETVKKFTEHRMAAGDVNFSNKLSAEQVTIAAKKLLKADTNFKSIVVTQCDKDSYCIRFLYYNTDSDGSALRNLLKKWSQEYGKDYLGTNIGPADVLL